LNELNKIISDTRSESRREIRRTKLLEVKRCMKKGSKREGWSCHKGAQDFQRATEPSSKYKHLLKITTSLQ
jgi:hypothetical protein